MKKNILGLICGFVAAAAYADSQELWKHILTASELVDVRDMSAKFDDSGDYRMLRLRVSKPPSWQKSAWIAIPPPHNGWDLEHVKNVKATMKNAGTEAVETTLWVVSSSGWAAVGSSAKLEAGETRMLSCDLREIYPDGTPKIDPTQVKQIRIMVQRADTTSLEIYGLVASGTVGDWVRPDGRLDVPEMVDKTPAAGQRVRYQLPGDAKNEIYCVLYLPTDWRPGKTYPVIAEYPGNFFYSATQCWSTGRPEQCAMGYGISSSTNAIWVSLPFVDRRTGKIAENGFGSNNGDDTVPDPGSNETSDSTGMRNRNSDKGISNRDTMVYNTAFSGRTETPATSV